MRVRADTHLPCAQAAAIGLLPRADAEPAGTGAAAASDAVGAGEIAPGDVHHGAKAVGAAAAHRRGTLLPVTGWSRKRHYKAS